MAASSGRPPQSASLRKLGTFCPSTIDGPDKQDSSGGPMQGPHFPLSCALAPASHLLLCFFPVGRPVASHLW